MVRALTVASHALQSPSLASRAGCLAACDRQQRCGRCFKQVAHAQSLRPDPYPDRLSGRTVIGSKPRMRHGSLGAEVRAGWLRGDVRTGFDHSLFRLTPREAAGVDPQVSALVTFDALSVLHMLRRNGDPVCLALCRVST